MTEQMTGPKSTETELTGGKTLSESKTVKSNVVSIVATLGTIVSIVYGGADPGLMIPALATCLGTLYGNVMSIIHRKNATEVIVDNKE